jgi:hypothetical protein
MKIPESSSYRSQADLSKTIFKQYELARKIRASALRARYLLNLCLGGNIYEAEIHQRHRWPARSVVIKWDFQVDYNTKEQSLLLALIEEDSSSCSTNYNGLAWDYNPEKGAITDVINHQGVVGLADPILSEGSGVISCSFEAWIGGQVIIPTLVIGGKRIQLPAHTFKSNKTLVFLTGSSTAVKFYPIFETTRFAMEPAEAIPGPKEVTLPINGVQNQVLEGLKSIRLKHGSIHQPLLMPNDSVFTKGPAISQPTRLVNIDRAKMIVAENEGKNREVSVLWETSSNPFVDQ